MIQNMSRDRREFGFIDSPGRQSPSPLIIYRFPVDIAPICAANKNYEHALREGDHISISTISQAPNVVRILFLCSYDFLPSTIPP